MPALEVTDLYQRAVVWPKAGHDSHGQPTVGAPYETAARWGGSRRQVLDKDGNNVALDATVVVVVDVAPGSIVWQGKLTDWLGTGSAQPDDELYEAVSFDSTPDLKNRYVRRTIGLKRYRNTLPQQV